METVSIIVTTHNEGDHLRRTVESILANTAWPESEIVLIDDGSSDGSLDFLRGEPYCGDARLRRFRHELPAGLIRARHEGVRRARGDYFAILDAHTAVRPGWLAMLAEAAERWGPFAAITPNIAVLDEESWSPLPSTGQLLTVDESLDMVWLDPASFAGTVPTVQGGCWFMPRQFYYQVGGLDLGLRRWGCEFIDLSFKIYAAGGACYYEPSVVVGHLFRSAFPYPMRHADLTYNKLRTGYVHLPERSFARLLDNLRDEPGFSEAMADFQADLSELNQLRRMQRAANRRDPDWFVRTFLPGLLDEPEVPRRQPHRSLNRKDTAVTPQMRRTVCPQCGATNVGAHPRCLLCQAALPSASESMPPSQPSPARPARKCCVQCGAALKPGRPFCTNCGQPVRERE